MSSSGSAVVRHTRIGRIGRWVAANPTPVAVLAVCIALSTGVISVAVYPFVLQSAGFTPATSEEGMTWDSFQAARTAVAQPEGVDQDPLSIQVGTLSLTFGLESGGNILTRENLKLIHKLERKIRDNDEYGDHCYRDPDLFDACFPASLINWIYPSTIEVSGNDVSVPDGEGKSMIDDLSTVLGDEDTAKQFSALVDTGFDTNKQKANYIRAFYFWGGPLEGYDRLSQDEGEQWDERNAWLRTWNDVFDKFNEDNDDLRVYYVGSGVTRREINSFILLDSFFSIGSVCLVTLYMLFHTHNVFLTLMGVTNIILSFPLSYFLLRVVLQQRMSSLNFMSVFVVLGIGADDVFIVIDALKQSTYERESWPSYLDRMEWVYNRSVSAMFVTSFTTAVSFLVAVISVIPAIRNFGLYAALIVTCNFVLICTFYFSIACIYDKYVVSYCWCSRSKEPTVVYDDVGVESESSVESGVISGSSNDSDASTHSSTSTAGGTANGKTRKSPQKKGVKSSKPTRPKHAWSSSSEHSNYSSDVDESEVVPTITCMELVREGPPKGFRRVEYFFYSIYAPFLYKYRRFVMMFFLVLFGVSVAFATQLAPKENAGQFLPEWSNLERSITLSEEFTASSVSFSFSAYVVWGVEGLDRSARDKDLEDDVGQPIYDKSFDLYKNQENVLEICDDMASYPKLIEADEISCFMRGFRDWVEDVNSTAPVHTFPVSDRSDFESALRQFKGESVGGQYADVIGFEVDSDRPNFVAVSGTTHIPDRAQAKRIRVDYEQWNKIVSDWRDKYGSDFKMVHTSEAWVEMAQDESLTQTALIGAGVSVVIAFLALSGTTRNFYLSSFSVVAMLGILSSLVAVMVILDWGMGFMESISLTVVVGLSVDYCVHIANAYVESEHTTRYEKTRDALRIIGISILGGAITSMLAAAMLFFGVITMSVSFGNLLFTNITLSAVFAFGLFTSILMEWGPEGESGHITKEHMSKVCCGESKSVSESESVSVSVSESVSESS